MPRLVNFDFTCTELKPDLRLPVTGGATALHLEMTIEAGDDPPGGMVGFWALRGDNTSKRKNRPKRPGLAMLEQGDREQIKLVADGAVMKGGFDLPSPGTHRISLDWQGATGISVVKNLNTGATISNAEKPGPVVGSGGITDGMLIFGGDPMPGGKVDYIPPYGWRFVGTVEVDRGDIKEQPGMGGSGGAGTGTVKPPEVILPPNPLPPIPVDIPVDVPVGVPVNIPISPSPPIPAPIPSPIPSPPAPPANTNAKPDWSAFPAVVDALTKFYPPIAENLSQFMPYIQALNAGIELADDGFDVSDPGDLIAVFQLISLFRGLRK